MKKLLFLLIVSIIQIASSRDIPVYLAQQNVISKQDLSKLKIQYKNIVSVSGSVLCWKKGDTIEKAISYPEDKVRKILQKYLKKRGFKDKDNMLFIIDLESPIHPKKFYTLKPDLFKKVVKAFKMRLRVARQVLPKSKLVLYGIMNAQSMGKYTPDVIKRFKALKSLSKLGVYDYVDYIAPVIYMRFGSKDKRKREATWEAMVRQGIEMSSLIKNSRGEAIPLAVMNSPIIFNSNSKSHKDIVPHSKYKKVIKVIAEYEPVKAIVFWIGSDKNLNSRKKAVHTINRYADIKDYFTRMNPVAIVNKSKIKPFKSPRALAKIK